MDNNVERLLEFGIVNIDKPSGPTSFSVSEFVMKKLGLRKTSHFGTLDPKVTGVLPIALNRACKLTGYFLGENKTYVGVMRLHGEVSLEKVQEKINENFVGEIIQMPPLKSRVKRQLRPRRVYSFEILEKNGNDFLFKVKCQGGTYIRVLCHDLGKELGVGGHMLELRRVEAGIFDEGFAVNLYEFEKAVDEHLKGNSELLEKIIIPAETAIRKIFPLMEIKKDNLKQIYTGKPIYRKDVIKDEGWKNDSILGVFCGNKFVGIYKMDRGKEIFARPSFVFQEIRN